MSRSKFVEPSRKHVPPKVPSRPNLKAISENVKKNKYSFGPVDPTLLEKFEQPAVRMKTRIDITIHIPEFTTLCPITGQPDYGTLEISYTPQAWCVESKALKLYLMSYRQAGAFHEQCVTRIGQDLVDLLCPRRLNVAGKFGARGGISFDPVYYYHAS